MESIDEQKARQVWQRVHGTARPHIDPTALIPLIAEETAEAAICLRLAKRLGGRGGPLLQIARQSRQNAGCMRGICAIVNGKPPATPVPPLREEPPQTALRKCYVNSLSKQQTYDSFSTDPDYGPVFAKMAATTRAQCAALLELIGKLT